MNNKKKNNLGSYIILIFTSLLISACEQHKAPLENKTWILNQDSSSISIITTKNNSISEVSDFKNFSGNIDSNNNLKIRIDLSSLETNIPIRNERIGKHLFQIDLYPTADIHTQLKPEYLNNGAHSVSFDVDLHGLSTIVQAEFMVFEQGGNKVITLHKPLVIKASDFALEKGITTLKNIAKLNSIDFTVPLHLILIFEPK